MTAKASVLAVRELIVARRRSPGECGSKDANTLVRSGRGRVCGSGRRDGLRAGRLEGEGRGGERATGRRPSREVLPEEARRARVLLGGALARGLPERPEPAFYTGRPRRRVLQ